LSYDQLPSEVLRLLAKADRERRAAEYRAHTAETRLGQTRAVLTRIAAQLSDLAALLGPDE
jgi:hypothetical protein